MRRNRWLVLLLGGLTGAGCVPSLGRPGKQVEHGNVSFGVAPNGEQIVFAGAEGDLHLFSLKTRKVVRLTETEAVESFPEFSPDGKTIVYAALAPDSQGMALFVRSLDGKQVRQVTHPVNRCDTMPSFSADGKHVVFAAAHRYRRYSMGGWIWDNFDVYLTRRDGTGLRRLTRASYYAVERPRLTPDGKTIVYAARLPYDSKFAGRAWGGSATALLETEVAAGKAPKMLVPLPNPGLQTGAWVSGPHLARDGKTIALISDRKVPFVYDVYLMNRKSTVMRSLKVVGVGGDRRGPVQPPDEPQPLGITNVSGYNQNPVLLPDGSGVLFLAGTERNAYSRPIFSLWQVDRDGGNARCVAGSELFTRPSEWKPPNR